MSVWEARFSALLDAEGAEWDRLHERIEEDWKREYRSTFVAVAIGRGWTHESATDWADDIQHHAFVERHDDDPRRMAKADMILCEMETVDA